MRSLKNHYRKLFLGLLALIFLYLSSSRAQMINPDIDRPDEPFTYFAYPVDVIGLMGCREGTEITPQGYLYTGYGELMFFYGSPPHPVNQRLKTLYKSYLPIIEYSFENKGVRYSPTLFAYTLDGNPETNIINFIRVKFSNLTLHNRTVYWWVGTRYTAESADARGIPNHRFRRPAEASKVGTYEQEGEEFSPEWEYSFDEGAMIRDGKAFYFFPTEIPHTKWIILKTPYSERWKNPKILPISPVGLVTKTLEVTQSKYREGIMTYWNGMYLHLHLTMKNSETEVIRGEQEKALREFYSILAHTSSTHAGFEWSIRAWGDRDFGGNLSPHGWFAAKFRTLLRNMLIREEEKDLHLLSVLSPSRVREGQRIEVTDAPTNFGYMDFSLEVEEDGARLKLDPKFRKKPEQIIFHIPWFVEIIEASADGEKIKVKENILSLNPQTKEVNLKWGKKPVGALSYDYFVQEYKEKYRDKYREFLEKGERK